jgi:hypothetical protein
MKGREQRERGEREARTTVQGWGKRAGGEGDGERWGSAGGRGYLNKNHDQIQQLVHELEKTKEARATVQRWGEESVRGWGEVGECWWQGGIPQQEPGSDPIACS